MIPPATSRHAAGALGFLVKGLRNRTQAAVMAHRFGLVDTGFNPVAPARSDRQSGM
ncbi:hypothetical protein [Microbispora sp. CA-102843]|uniref:hypothetical protein n=1 Tax=Microbispora sp. CA-102843 TaxID=3239952 RepID=UPI003D8C2409